VTVEYDDGPRKGEKETMSKRDLLSKLDAAHGISAALQSEREKQAKVISELRASGASEKQIAREQARLDRLGTVTTEADTLGAFARQVLEKARVTPDKVTAALASFSKSRGRTSTNPDVMFTARLQELTAGDTAAYCESYNKALERAAQENAAVLSAIEVYKQAKIEALAANPDPIIADEARLKYIQEHTQNERRAYDEAGALYAQRLKEAALSSTMDAVARREYVRPAATALREAREQLGWAEIPFRAEAERLYPVVTHTERQEKIKQYTNAAGYALLQAVSAANADFLYKTLYPADVLHARHQPAPSTAISLTRFDLVGELAHIEDILSRAYPARAQEGQKTYIHISRPKKDFREKCDANTIHLTTATTLKTAAHELAHTLERHGQAYEGIERAVTLTHLTRINQGAYKQYKGKELYFEDQYTDNYTGKLYHDGQSELVSMGVENFFKTTDANDQAWNIALFAAADPHHYLLTYAILKGYTQP
jgi:hypothetical protein